MNETQASAPEPAAALIPADTPLTATLPLWAWLVVLRHLYAGIYVDVAPTLNLITQETLGQYDAACRRAQIAMATEGSITGAMH
jgi:hypothetical protein